MGMDSLNDLFFSSTNQESMSYDQILEDVQRYCTSQHADKLSTEGNQEEARNCCGNLFSSISPAAPTMWMNFPLKSCVTPCMKTWQVSLF